MHTTATHAAQAAAEFDRWNPRDFAGHALWERYRTTWLAHNMRLQPASPRKQMIVDAIEVLVRLFGMYLSIAICLLAFYGVGALAFVSLSPESLAVLENGNVLTGDVIDRAPYVPGEIRQRVEMLSVLQDAGSSMRGLFLLALVLQLSIIFVRTIASRDYLRGLLERPSVAVRRERMATYRYYYWIEAAGVTPKNEPVEEKAALAF
jgi:hypothetical protein